MEKAARRYAQERPWFEAMFSSSGSDPELVKEGRAHREGSPSPLGAAVEIAVGWHHTMVDVLVDACVTEHGLRSPPVPSWSWDGSTPITSSQVPDGTTRRCGERRLPDLPRVGDRRPCPGPARGGRRGDPTADRRGPRRLRDSVERRIVVSYLVPESTPGRRVLRRSDTERLRPAAHAPSLPVPGRSRSPASAKEHDSAGTAGTSNCSPPSRTGSVPPSVPAGDAFDGAYGSDGHRDVAGWAAELPTDDAFRLLLRKGGDRNVRPACSTP
ncbi:hypothetical protein GCM10023238_32050 [Streptomyces heliomycini]